jgi:hypothetical protein
MGTIAKKKDRRDKNSKGAAMRTSKKAAPKAEKAPPAKAKKTEKEIKAEKKTASIKAAPAKAPSLKAKPQAAAPQIKKEVKDLNPKKQAAPKKAQVGKVVASRPATGESEHQAVRSFFKAADTGKIKEGHCPNCSVFSNCRRRDFSEQAMTVLLLWGEIAAASVDQPICDDCYDELREVLIDRADEVDAALAGKGVDRVREMISRAAS